MFCFRAFITVSLAIGVALTSRTPIRLTGGVAPNEGNVEVFFNGEWKYICDDTWDIRDAKVVCRSLDYTKGLEAFQKSYFEVTSNASYWLDDVQCWGSERDITYCWHKKSNKHDCAHGKEIAGVICSDEKEIIQTIPLMFLPNSGDPPAIRLDGKSIHGFISSGWLQVKNKDVWRSVCTDTWTSENSFVACGHLGFPDVEGSLESTENDDDSNEIIETYWLKDIKCVGTESTLFECPHSGWRKQFCERPVYLKCKRSPLLRENRFDKAVIGNHNIRLRSGSSHSEGRVEVLHNKRWGTICDDGWSIKNANVFCRQMGFGTAYEAVSNGQFGQAIGKIWLDEVKCVGSEDDIRKCQHLDWGDGDCGHAEDAGVRCHFPSTEFANKVRVVGGNTKRVGRVEVDINGEWRGVCARKWGPREAEVVCRQLKLGYGYRGYTSSEYGVSDEIAMFHVRCAGDELALQHCHHKSSGKCRSYEMVVVECSETAPDIVVDYRQLKRSLRVQSRSLYDLTCAYEENCLSSSASSVIHYPNMFSRTLLRFTSRYWNRGTAAFVPFKEKSAWQWHQCHAHYHSMERFSDYDLTDANRTKIAEGHKASFCLEDSKCEKGVSKFFNCTGGGNQGVSVNCADNYKWNIDCQWIDVSDVKYGEYKLRVIINPLRKVVESDYSNNIAVCNIHLISESQVNVTHCQLEWCEQMSHGGTSGGACCKFPFIYKGKEYHSCTTDGFGNTLWCGTTTHYRKDKLWGYC